MVAALERCLACESVGEQRQSCWLVFNLPPLLTLWNLRIFSFRSESKSAKSVHDIECRSRFGLLHEMALLAIGLASEAALHGPGAAGAFAAFPTHLLTMDARRYW